MTVLYLLHSTDPASGATKSFLTLLREAMARGVRPIVAGPDGGGVLAALRAEGVATLTAPSRPACWTDSDTPARRLLFLPRQAGRLLLNAVSRRRLARRLRSAGVDLAHSNTSTEPLGDYVARRLGVPRVVHVREYGDTDFHLRYFPSWRAMHRRLRRSGVYTICITRDIQRHHGLEGSPSSRVIYNGVASAAPSPHSGAGGTAEAAPRRFFLYAGRLEPAKGLHLLIEAYADYAASQPSPLPLRVAGADTDTAYALRARALARERGVEGLVQFLGQRADMDSLYDGALALVVPSASEGFGRCLPEAMARGCLAIGRDTGGTREQLDNGLALTGGEIGLRFTTRDGLAQALRAAHRDGDTALRPMRERAARATRALYSPQAHAEAVLALYRDMLNSHT